MKRSNCSNPRGLGFAEMMLCTDSVFIQVCREIEAGDWNRARALLNLTEAVSDSLAKPAQRRSFDKNS